MPRQRRHKKRTRRPASFPGLYKAVSVLAIAGAVVVACLVFFRVGDIVVQGNTRYTDREIIQVAGVELGDNLFTIRGSKVSRQLQSKLPYVRTVSVRSALPGTVIITITEADAAAAVGQDGRWWLLDSQCKLLEETTGPQGHATVTGLTPVAPAVGTYLATGEETAQRLSDLREFLAAMEEHGLLEGLNSVDLSEDYRITFVYGGRLTVHLSPTLDKGMSYWLRRFGAALEHPSVMENLDYTVEIMDSQRVRFIPDQEKQGS